MDSTRANELIKTSREILKQVDQLVKSNNLEKALHEVKKARELDPKNIYAFAYEERIQELFAKRQVQQVLNSNYPQTITGTAEARSPQSTSPSTDQYNLGTKIPTLYEEFKKAGLHGFEPVGSLDLPQHATKEALETYKQALLLIWSDGQKTSEEEKELQDLRKSLFISNEEHERLDRQAKLECYIFFLKHLMKSSASKTEIEVSLSELRHGFDISSTDHLRIEAKIMTLKDSTDRKKVIVVVDDEKQILSMIKEMLVLYQYDVKDFVTSDEALDFLKSNKVDLILSDISLETSTMNGFLLYDRIREVQHLQQIPFIFFTGLNDAVLIRAAKEMGVDDFIIKPIHRENLLATIRGKIKRYEQMKILSGM